MCGYDLNLTYPQNGKFPTLRSVDPSDPHRSEFQALSAKREFFRKTLSRFAFAAPTKASKRAEEGATAVTKRDLSQRANGTIDPWYGCFIYDELIDYALNFSAPWSESICMDARFLEMGCSRFLATGGWQTSLVTLTDLMYVETMRGFARTSC